MRNNKAIILFDGICKLCNNSVSFVVKRDKKKQFRFVPLESEEGKHLIVTYRISPETDSIILIRNNRVFIESDAAIEISKLLPSPWSWLAVLKIVPKKWRDKFYRWVAKNRYRWFGKRDICDIGY